MNKYTKITASIGPNCEDKETLTRMIRAGVNMCRLNFSHDTGDTQGAKIDLIREISSELDMPVAIMIDLQGPKHRIGNLKQNINTHWKSGKNLFSIQMIRLAIQHVFSCLIQMYWRPYTLATGFY